MAATIIQDKGRACVYLGNPLHTTNYPPALLLRIRDKSKSVCSDPIRKAHTCDRSHFEKLEEKKKPENFCSNAKIPFSNVKKQLHRVTSGRLHNAWAGRKNARVESSNPQLPHCYLGTRSPPGGENFSRGRLLSCATNATLSIGPCGAIYCGPQDSAEGIFTP